MVKQLIISPAEVRRHETIELGSIPVNQYRRSLADELAAKTLTPADAVRLYRDMVLIREFETMLDEIKRQGKYRDIAYVHQGPAHLSIGQEAAAVGEAFLLTVDDHIFGSHRSHGEILAKGLSAIHRLDEPELQRIMEGYLGGDTLRVVEREPAASGKDLAVNYLLYGLLAEIFARATGFQPGPRRFHARFLPPLRDLSQQCHRGRQRGHRRGLGPGKEDAAAARDHDCQHRGRVGRLRSGLGRDALRDHGAILDPVGAGLSGWPAHHLCLHEQLLRDGRADAW